MIKKTTLTIFAALPFVFIILFLSIPSFSSKFNWFPNEPYVASTVEMKIFSEDRLFDLVQNWRQSKGLPTYKKSERLCGVADRRLEDVEKDFTHDKFFISNESNNWYGYHYLGENLIKGMFSEQASLNGWLRSPKHLENLENKIFTESCIRCSGSTCVHIFGGY